MMNLRKPLIAALSGVFLASALSWAAPVAPVRAAPGDVSVGLAYDSMLCLTPLYN